MSTWTALYLPSTDDGYGDPSKSGFPSYRAARKWLRKNVINRPCGKGCSKIRDGYKDVIWCEWIFIEDEKLNECNDLGDIFDNAHGFTRVE